SGIKKEETRVIIELGEDSNTASILEKLGFVFGIEWYSYGIRTKKSAEDMWGEIRKRKKLLEGKTFKVETKRADKSFPVNSMEFSKKLGGYIYEGLGNPVDLKNPEILITAEILNKNAYVLFGKNKGLGGLPLGSAGKVLCLLSGGFDSPVAAWMMMKRGCTVDFLHIHSFPDNEKIKDTKIMKIVEVLERYGNKGKLYCAPYEFFYKKTFGMENRYELVLFRRFLYKLAERIALDKEYLGIVSGDSLGQVASQTLENIGAVQGGITVPIFRPLIGFDKLEILGISKKIGLYEISKEKYKDCCSLVAMKNPVTRAKKEILDRIAKELELEKTLNETLEEMSEF
ncbi:tRNA 4-thiouridine(8) synthase ThiI, partial [Candidatus Micrarchaeota archaeon]|nr:tRNA 4-thiouridine(8) synthase ThiI [Candidatus Micrarchaeota archaeon]